MNEWMGRKKRGKQGFPDGLNEGGGLKLKEKSATEERPARL